MHPVRLVHVSDIHITSATCDWRRQDWFSKRLAAWLNLRWLGRGRRFGNAETVLAALMEHFQQSRPDRVVFSGDATALGFDEEMERACDLLGLRGPEPLPGIAVPGNHDYCTRRAASGSFERYFAAWQQGERVDGHTYPFAQRVGHVWLVGVCSATPNLWPWDASGGVGEGQLARLRALLKRLQGGPRILVTHYPVCLSTGQREGRTHQLRDMVAVARVASEGGVGLWLHGHRHDPYVHPRTIWTSFPVICCGSSTQNRLWSYGEYAITGNRLQGVRKTYDLASGQFREAAGFKLELPGPDAGDSSSR
jgi:3',5'-cyclic AMP phosphodiesterase CpdA